MAVDYLGDEMPEGYIPWMCHVCTAVCNFEAMTQCAKYHGESECGFDRDQPESNHGAFGFIIKEGRAMTTEEGVEYIRVSKKTLDLMTEAAILLQAPIGPSTDVGDGWYEIPLTTDMVKILEKKEDFESHDQYLGDIMNVLVKRLKSMQ